MDTSPLPMLPALAATGDVSCKGGDMMAANVAASSEFRGSKSACAHCTMRCGSGSARKAFCSSLALAAADCCGVPGQLALLPNLMAQPHHEPAKQQPQRVLGQCKLKLRSEGSKTWSTEYLQPQSSCISYALSAYVHSQKQNLSYPQGLA